MFESHNQYKVATERAGKDTPRPLSRRFVLAVAISSVISLIVLFAGCMLLIKTPSIEKSLDKVESEIGRKVIELCGMSASSGLNEISKMHVEVGAWLSRFKDRGDFTKRDREIDRVQNLYRLKGVLESWELKLSSVPSVERETYWKDLMKDVVEEAKRWAGSPVLDKPRYGRDTAENLLEGMHIGSVWPVGIVKRTFFRVRGLRGTSKLSFSTGLRYIFYPYHRWSFSAIHVIGFGFATILVGYGLCWLGSRFNLAGLSYLGILYFVHMAVFATFLICIVVIA